MAAEEQVLVVKREVIEELGMFHGLQPDVDRYLDALFAPGQLSFMPRSKAEENPDFKQLIPYVLMGCNGRYLSYVRGKRAGETRLVSKRSMGIGGHINPVDSDMERIKQAGENPLFPTDYRHLYNEAVNREIEEEVDVKAKHKDRIIGLLNDDTNEVGQVHLGVVHLWELDSEDVTKIEQMITQIGFSSIDELNEVKDTMETWSQLCLEGLEKI